MKKKFILLSLALLSLGSCKSFLDEKPYDFVASDTFYTSENDIIAGLNGTFSALLPQLYFGRTAWQITELPGDYVRVGSSTDERSMLSRFAYDERLSEINNYWTSVYLMLNRANDVVERAPAVQMDAARKNNLIGNARFLRAMGYFDLVRCFGDVPLVLNTVKSPSDNLKPARTPLADVYAQIIQDLQFAEANCVTEDKIIASEKGRVSKGAAAALLAKVYLTRASTSAAQSSDMQSALSAVTRVTSSGLYRLVPTYSDVFDPDKENGPEHIFSLQFDLPPNIGSIIVRQFTPTQIVSDGLGTFSVEPTFEASYATTDVRRAWNITNKAGTTTLPRYYFVKFKDPLRITNDSRCNYLVTRYADVLLMQSEILNNLNASDPTKYAGINAVRARAGLAALTGTTTQDAFVTLLLRERGWELCIEGHRWYDLVRMKKLAETVLATKPTTILTAVAPRYYLFPIPTNERILNPNLTQNPGYN